MDKKDKLETQFISNPKEIKQVEETTFFYDSDGTEYQEVEKNAQPFARRVCGLNKDGEEKETHFVLFNSGEMADPVSMTDFGRKRSAMRYKRVTKSSFNSYLKYLSTKNRKFLLNAMRNK